MSGDQEAEKFHQRFAAIEEITKQRRQREKIPQPPLRAINSDGKSHIVQGNKEPNNDIQQEVPVINTLPQNAESVARPAAADEDNFERERNQGGTEDQQAAVIEAQIQQILNSLPAVPPSNESVPSSVVIGDAFLDTGEPATAQARAEDGAGVEETQNNDEDDDESGLSDLQLEQIETTEISNQQVQDGASCSICMTLFHEREPVSKLPCQHLYHTRCIIEKLQDGTCPTCHKNLSE